MALESPVLDILESLGAHRAERSGRVTAAHFGDPPWEYEAVRSSVGIIDASHFGAVRIAGNDRAPFLQNMLTHDVHDLEPCRGRLTSLLDTKGKFVALFRLLAFHDSFLALLEGEWVDRLIRGLERFLIVEDVTLNDESLRWGIVHVAGPESRKLLSSLSGSPFPHIRPGEYRLLSLPGIPEAAWAVKNCVTGEEGYDLIVPREKLGPAWKLLVRHEGPRPVPVGADPFGVLRVEAGTPLFGVDVTPDLGPIEAGLDEVVSLEKGSFVGREAVARMRRPGKPPKRLVGLKVAGEGIPPPGATVLSGGKSAGRITSAVFSPHTGGVLALAVVRAAALEKGAALRVMAGGAEVAAEPAETPFRS